MTKIDVSEATNQQLKNKLKGKAFLDNFNDDELFMYCVDNQIDSIKKLCTHIDLSLTRTHEILKMRDSRLDMLKVRCVLFNDSSWWDDSVDLENGEYKVQLPNSYHYITNHGRLLKEIKHNIDKYEYIKLVEIEPVITKKGFAKFANRHLDKMMAEYFVDKPADYDEKEYVVVHKNKLLYDIDPRNLCYMTKEQKQEFYNPKKKVTTFTSNYHIHCDY